MSDSDVKGIGNIPSTAFKLDKVVIPGQSQTETTVTVTQASSANTYSGALQAFREVRRTLTQEEMSNPGVQALLLDKLESAIAQCERLASYESRFHDKDKRVDVLEERQAKRVALDIAWGTGVAVGLALVGLSPVVWTSAAPPWAGPTFLVVGSLLIVGGIAIRVVMR